MAPKEPHFGRMKPLKNADLTISYGQSLCPVPGSIFVYKKIAILRRFFRRFESLLKALLKAPLHGRTRP
jgi:hypothetical protein